jgi:GWxTD domain-containing protein
MKILEHLVSTSWAEAIGWTLLHSLWEGTVIAILLAAAMFGVRSPRARYLLACTAILAMLTAFCLTAVWLLPHQAENATVLRGSRPLWDAIPEANRFESWNLNLAAVAPWLGPFWFAGVWLICIWHVASWVFAQRLRRRGVVCANDVWQEKIADFSRMLRISRTVVLVESCLTEVPVILGHLHPLILLPIGLLSGLPGEQVEAILIHELAHISRHDYFVNLLQRFAEAFFFYHPAAWWISKVIRTEREHCCDDIVVSITRNAHEYSVALAALEEKRLSGRELAIAATGGNLMKRIHRMLEPQAARNAWTPLFTVIVLVVTAVATAAAWQSEAPKHVRDAAQVVAGAPTPSVYSKWLNEDVIYIADDAERARYRQLTTDEERNHFIEQFWERRNPVPGSSPNKFREDHYRRIAYANEHFRTAAYGAPGWRSDRGHIYIVYGPPDEIEAHPKGTGKPFATELWVYRHVEGTDDIGSFTFLDKTGQGDYHLVPGK